MSDAKVLYFVRNGVRFLGKFFVRRANLTLSGKDSCIYVTINEKRVPAGTHES